MPVFSRARRAEIVIVLVLVSCSIFERRPDTTRMSHTQGSTRGVPLTLTLALTLGVALTLIAMLPSADATNERWITDVPMVWQRPRGFSGASRWTFLG